MLLLKLIQQLIKALNSQGTPGQVAAGLALGAAFGLTPIANAHNLVLFALALILNVSLAGVFLGWSLAVPLGFALDPLFDSLGAQLLGASTFAPLWTSLYNTPGAALTNFNNTVVLGSFVFWLASVLPVFFLARWAVARYRESVYRRLKQTRLFKGVAASQLFSYYRILWPG